VSAIEPIRRVALLARPGVARDRLRQALQDAGGQVVLEADPAALSAQALAEVGADAVLVALEPAVEDALPALDAALHAPGVRVIFDEADLAATREGWAAQRWVRHLAAKLHGHGDVLPPGGETEVLHPQPGRPPTPAQMQAGAEFDLHRQEAELRAANLPRDGLAGHIAGFDGIVQDEPEAWTPRPPAVADGMPESFEWEAVALPAPTPLPAATPQRSLAAADTEGDASMIEPDALDRTPPSVGATPRTPLRLELEALEPALAGASIGGAVFVVGGIGGPDAIRKLLGALSAHLDRPVLLRVRLDGGRYDNLVKQIGRVSPLPVVLAEAGRPLRPGAAYVLPEGLGVAVVQDALAFTEGVSDHETIAALPPETSAVLMLSGGDPGLADAALALAARGALVAAQSVEGCYDSAGPDALAAQGIDRDTPAGLAQRVLQQRGRRG